jgi:anti-anti-sigma factor
MNAAPAELGNLIHVERAGDVTIVRFKCSTVLGTELAEAVALELYRLAGSIPQPRMVVNLGGVTLMSSHMLGNLVGLREFVIAARGRLILCAIVPEICEVLGVLGLEAWFTISPDEPKALELASAPGAAPTTAAIIQPATANARTYLEWCRSVATVRPPAGLSPDSTGAAKV